MKTEYEWVVEETDEFGDIIDTNGFPTYAEAKKFAEPGAEIALVRYTGDESTHDRFYAYLKGGRLGEYFEDGPKVPKRFHQEVR